MTCLLMAMLTATASAMSLSSARSQALFLTDKMAYELNLTDDQYSAAYEINLDYIMSIDGQDDLYGTYWTHRNSELSYVLSALQYRQFMATAYFYRPVTWVSNRFQFSIYNKYTRNKYYHHAPAVYATYKGGNSHYENSAYKGRTFTQEANRNVRQASQAGNEQPTMTRHEAIQQTRNRGNSEDKVKGQDNTSRTKERDNSSFGGHR